MTQQPTEETLPQLYFETGKIHERLAKWEIDRDSIEAKDNQSHQWQPLKGWPAQWRFLRERPRAKTPEELRVEANLRVHEEWRPLFIRNEHEGRFEVFNHSEEFGEWRDCDRMSPTSSHLEYRRKHAPEYVPWSFEDQLCGKVLARKDGTTRQLVVWQRTGSAGSPVMTYSYADLLRDWQQLDGTPAGKLKA